MILFWLLYCQAESVFVGWDRALGSVTASCLSGGVNGVSIVWRWGCLFDLQAHIPRYPVFLK